MGEVDPRVLLAEMVIGLGIKTYAEVHSYLSQNSDDDVQLAANLSDLNARLTRRGIPIPPVSPV